MYHLNKEKTQPKKAKTGWESPVGWWRVTTEGDEEGRTVDVVRDFYGHVAEIALSAECRGYKLTFRPINGRKKPNKRPAYTVDADRVITITLGMSNSTWKLNTDRFVLYVSAWLAYPDVVVTPSNYFSSVTIQIRNYFHKRVMRV